MPTMILPFVIEEKVEKHDRFVTGCTICDQLPADLRSICAANPHLLRYIHTMPVNHVGFPQYCEKLTKQMGDNKEPNYIYPVTENIFIHIMVDHKDFRHTWIPIEPTFNLDIEPLVKAVELKCIKHGETLPEFDEDKDKTSQLIAYIDLVTEVMQQKTVLPKIIAAKKGAKAGKIVKVRVTSAELEGIKYLFVRDKIGIGVLEPFVLDPYTEDISCSGLGPIYIEHKVFKSIKSIVNFMTVEDLDEFVLRLAEQTRKQVSMRNPISDATLPSGARINIVYGTDISKRGSNFTVRQFSKVPVSIFGLIDAGSLNYQMLAYLSLAIGNGMNTFVAGETASGKTTLLNAITTFFHPLAKIITIEDTPELQVPHENWVREVVQTTKSDDSSGAVTMFDLLRAALRQRPNWILVGEIRGEEGAIAFQAMQTGHSVMATFHAASVEKLIQRITSNPISVPKSYIDNLNLAVIMASVKLPNGKVGRRVLAISEIVGYDTESESFDIIEAFHWDKDVDKFSFPGYMTSHILERKIAPRLGIPTNKRTKVYAELDRRAKILEKMHKEQHITDFYAILEVLGKAQREGLF